jgi:hypothetical protein
MPTPNYDYSKVGTGQFDSADPSVMGRVTGDSSDSDINSINTWMRSQPWYQQIVQANGGNANKDQIKAAIIKGAQQNGVQIDQSHIEVDDTGNLKTSGMPTWEKVAIIAGIAAGGWVAAPYVAGALAAGGGGGGLTEAGMLAGEAGGAAAALGTIPAIAGSTGGLAAGAGAAGAASAGGFGFGGAGAAGAGGATAAGEAGITTGAASALGTIPAIAGSTGGLEALGGIGATAGGFGFGAAPETLSSTATGSGFVDPIGTLPSTPTGPGFAGPVNTGGPSTLAPPTPRPGGPNMPTSTGSGFPYSSLIPGIGGFLDTWLSTKAQQGMTEAQLNVARQALAQQESMRDPFLNKMQQVGDVNKLSTLANWKPVSLPKGWEAYAPQGGANTPISQDVVDAANTAKTAVLSGQTDPSMADKNNWGKSGALDLLALAGRRNTTGSPEQPQPLDLNAQPPGPAAPSSPTPPPGPSGLPRNRSRQKPGWDPYADTTAA